MWSCPRESNRGLFKHFFGEDGKKRMQLAHFDEFLRGLHDEIVRLEFTHYDFKNQVCLVFSLHQHFSIVRIPFLR